MWFRIFNILLIYYSLNYTFFCLEKNEEKSSFAEEPSINKELNADSSSDAEHGVIKEGAVSLKTETQKTSSSEITSQSEVSLDKKARSSPFLTSEEDARFSSRGKEKRVKKIEKNIPQGLALTAIFYKPPESFAVINGCVVSEEDYVDDKRVVEIQREGVILEDDDKEYELELREVTSKEYGTLSE